MANHIDSLRKWRIYHDDFKAIMGPGAAIELLLQIDDERASKDHLGQLGVQISKITLGTSGEPTTIEKIDCDLIHMANGGVRYDDGILFCAQGSSTRPSGLFKMQASAPFHTEPVLTGYLRTPFNAVNDVVVHQDGSIWFTDPSYGHDQGYRPHPSLPNAVYRYDPASGSIRAVADSFEQPNSICFSPDGTTVYVTDTDQVRGPCVDYGRAASI
ncbi:hypothetical protein QQX98_012018 [Neonectria punicea]|uniref:SMP-30/Gluconolactonase/LRE-like region domain-containing protein n=1 Tax=Neonectria punicea TaxID=979145 RepID=A0ABR1GK28_9HYPO